MASTASFFKTNAYLHLPGKVAYSILISVHHLSCPLLTVLTDVFRVWRFLKERGSFVVFG